MINRDFNDILLNKKYVQKTNTCWLYLGSSSNGYCRVFIRGERDMVHRWSYRYHNGKIPVGYQIDHLCGIKNCINPKHLEAVTPRENTLRSNIAPASINAKKKVCIRGHRFSKNLNYHGNRFCRTCMNIRQNLVRNGRVDEWVKLKQEVIKNGCN